MSNNSLGQQLIEAVQEAIACKKPARTKYTGIDIAALRKQLKLIQKEFAATYYIKLQTLRNWGQEKRTPDSTTLAYLSCIAAKPKMIYKILHPS